MHIFKKQLALAAIAMAMAAQTAHAGLTPTLVSPYEPQQQDGYYIITSAGHLQWLAEYVNSAAYMDKPTYLKVRLGSDVAKATHSDYIDAIGGQYVTLTNGNKVKSYFYGEFDGQNHSVGFNMRPLDQCTNNGYPNSSFRGLFGSVQNSNIHNVLVNAPVVEGNSYVGGLAGSASNTAFTDITVYYPQITIKGNNGGGIVGSAENSSSFKYCVTTNGRPEYTGYVRQNNTFTAQGIVGGIVGNLRNSSATYCVNTVDVYIKDWGEIAGGIAGQHFANTSSQTISHCGNTGTISSSSHISSLSNGEASGHYAGGIVGYTNSASGVSYTFDECFTDAPVNALQRCGYIVGWAGSKTDGSASRLTLTNCYYVQTDCKAGYGSSVDIALPMTQSPNNTITDKGIYRVTEQDFQYGRVAYELNHHGGDWAQSLCLGKVDILGRTPTPEKCTTFNLLSKMSYPVKVYARHGLRGHCGSNVTNHDCDYCKLPAYAIEEPTRDSKGVLQISKREHLLWLREMHNALALHSGEDHSKSNIDIPTFDATLTADIALVPEISVGVYHKWTGIGTELVPYTGTFDGARHTIAGLDADYQAEEYSHVGLFGLTSGATIKNVKIARSTFGGSLFVGAIVGDASGKTTISTCYTAPDVTVIGTMDVGGIVGCSNSNGTVTSCTNCAEVKAKNISSYSVARSIGGIGGYVDGTISGCLNFGKVGIDNRQVQAAFIGGIAGEARGTLRYCGNAANINENFSSTSGRSQYVGGIVGSIGGANSTGNFGWSENFSSADKVCGAYSMVGLVAGYAVTSGTMYSTFVRSNTRYEGYDVTNKIIAETLSGAQVGISKVETVEASTFSDGSLPARLATNGSGWGQILCTDEVPRRSGVFNKAGQYVSSSTVAEHGSQNASGNCPYCNDPLGVEPSQDGEGYYLVSRPHHLIWFREQAAAWTGDVNNRYTFKARLENDIDLSACRVWTSIGNPGDPSSEGALPIEVTFDGQGHTICGLGHKGDDYIRFSDKCGGLFGNLFESNITNLTVDTSWPGAAPIESFYYSTAPNAGILCASASGASFITGVTTKGTLTGTARSTGGIAGYSAFAQFTDCTNDASILCNQSDANTDADTPTGGIVGEAYFLCIFDRCVNNGEVMVSQHKNFTGGLIGRVNELAQIDNCANTGKVSNTAKCSDPNCQHGKMGGLIGGVVTVGLTDQVGFTIHNTWSSGLVENKYGTYETGSFIGYVEKNCKPDLDVFSNCVTRMGGEPIGWAPAGFPHDITGVNEDGFARGTAASCLIAPWGHNVIIGTDGLLQADPADRYPQLDGTPVYSATISKVVFQGDANEDGRWTADDANDFSEQLAAGHLDNEPSSALLRMFDTNHDGRFSILDLTTFIRKMMAVGE